ncbi:hypothetical protein BH10CYA1_BH10CYA1_39280 [soil metagenome]
MKECGTFATLDSTDGILVKKMITQTPILKPTTYIRPPEQPVGSADLDSIKLLVAAVILAIVACMAAVAVSTAICLYVAPASETQSVGK